MDEALMREEDWQPERRDDWGEVHTYTRRYTRHCVLHGCRHAPRANSPAYFHLRPLYAATVTALLAGGRGLCATANVGFYLVLIPALLGWLTHAALRDAGRIWQLKQRA